MTNDLVARIYQHKHDLVDGFTKRYQTHNLVYFELYDDVTEAISREKQIKAGSRKKKEALINDRNPQWKDLYDELIS